MAEFFKLIHVTCLQQCVVRSKHSVLLTLGIASLQAGLAELSSRRISLHEILIQLSGFLIVLRLHPAGALHLLALRKGLS